MQVLNTRPVWDGVPGEVSLGKGFSAWISIRSDDGRGPMRCLFHGVRVLERHCMSIKDPIRRYIVDDRRKDLYVRPSLQDTPPKWLKELMPCAEADYRPDFTYSERAFRQRTDIYQEHTSAVSCLPSSYAKAARFNTSQQAEKILQASIGPSYTAFKKIYE